ncbi:MAG: anti-sigma regulatory factor [Firmicutes bacterium]|nr:anti-sigma regulatory factor [Bacillota bacterium]
MDFQSAGTGASRIKRTLQEIGLDHSIVRCCAVCAYEAEMNIVIHAWRGILRARISPEAVEIVAEDEGPGIRDIVLAMQEGYSTAPPHIREMGFGAGMGLPNMKRCSDEMSVESEPGIGTTVRMTIKTGRPHPSK